ncbi:MAG: excinuclease ABC subunit UvrA [Bacteroidales bacterium]|nr:excinuclease ABC subunit UvrA [Bacteroidales bacterium]
MTKESSIIIKNARENNLKGITVEIPRGKLVVITGVSGSGKSSLAFDTLFAEGQRRFAESLSSYARQFLGRMSKPDVDIIEGIPPAIAIEQKVNIKNPRSTVATTTEIYDFLRLLFARIGRTYSPVSGGEVKAHSVKDVLDFLSDGTPRAVYILSDIGWNSRQDKVEYLLALKEEGFGRLFNPADSSILQIEDVLRMDGAYPAGLMLLVDRVKTTGTLDDDLRARLHASVQTAFDKGNGDMALWVRPEETGVSESSAAPTPPTGCASGPLEGLESGAPENRSIFGVVRPRVARDSDTPISSGLVRFCARFELDGITFRRPDEYLFSFNSPLGACPVCGGLGKIIGISEDLVVPDKTKSIYDGAIACWRGEKMSWFKDQLIKNAERLGISIFEPYCKLTEEQKRIIWTYRGDYEDPDAYCGIDQFFEWVESNRYKIQYKYMLSRYSGRTTCSACGGSRLRKEALYVKIAGKTIHDLLSMTVEELLKWFDVIAGPDRQSLTETEQAIAGKTIEEIRYRLQCIEDVGLGYLTLSRTMNTLSGGESQRVNLVTALGSSLVGSMYILDEPSIGLHPRDTDRLIAVLRRLRDIGNTVVVVEHDPEIIKAADYLIDLGPRAGINGGEVVFEGKIPDHVGNDGKTVRHDAKAVMAGPDRPSLTLQYLFGQRQQYQREKNPWRYSITIKGAMQNNLKDIDVRIPLNVFTVVSGVSGSGKSSLVGDILYPAMHRRLNETGDVPGTFKGLEGDLSRITRVEYVDQNPIGKSSRSNAVTYLKVYDDIRKLLSQQQYARINGFTPSYFSFNQEGGRCPECQGDGFVKIGMQFMADVTMVCESCGGKRFKPEILEVNYKGLNVSDILDLSVDEAIAFFGAQKEPEAIAIAQKLQPLVDVGLGYIKLGQPSSTLSGGESQRIKLAYFLSISDGSRDKILFIFDEPTTGLHFHDVQKLLKAFDALIGKGHTVLVVEHNLDVIRAADWVIDLGPDAGDRGGEVVFEGTPEDLKKQGKTFTAKYL